MSATYDHGIYGPRRLDMAEAVRLLKKVTDAYGEVIEQLHEYDSEHPEIWASCSEHPDGDCGYRDMPGFFLTACVTTCDVQDARRFLAAYSETDGSGDAP